MTKTFKSLSLAAALVAGTALSASAATLSLVGSGYTDFVLGVDGSGAFSLAGKAVYSSLQGGVGDVGDHIMTLTGSAKNATNGLAVNSATHLKFTFLGSEAANTDWALNFASILFGNKVSSAGDVAMGSSGAGLIPFSFSTTLPTKNVASIDNAGVASGINGADTAPSIGYSAVFNGGKSILVYFDDKSQPVDKDYDDMAMRIDVVPVPAAGFLMIGAIGGLAALRRRKKAA